MVFASILLMASCQKKDTTPADLSKVTVTFASPLAGQVVHVNDTVQVSAEVSYNAEIIGVGIQIIDTATSDVVFAEDHDLHTDHYSIDESWVNTLTDSTVLCAKVTVFVANSDERTERLTYFTAKP